MPNPGELPGVGGAIVPGMRAGVPFVDEIIAHRVPTLAAIIGTVHHLPKPTAGLGGVDPIRIGR